MVYPGSFQEASALFFSATPCSFTQFSNTFKLPNKITGATESGSQRAASPELSVGGFEQEYFSGDNMGKSSAALHLIF